LDILLKQAGTDGSQRRPGSDYLLKDFQTVSVFIQHALNASDLSGNPIKLAARFVRHDTFEALYCTGVWYFKLVPLSSWTLAFASLLCNYCPKKLDCYRKSTKKRLAVTMIQLLFQHILRIDQRIVEALSARTLHPVIIALSVVAGWLGTFGFVWQVFSAVLSWQVVDLNIFLWGAVGMGTLFLFIEQLIKKRWPRSRPLGTIAWESSSTQSFPSGHTAGSGFGLVYLGGLQPGWLIGLILVVLWIALSRVALLRHYPSDVVAGLLLGGLWGWGIYWVAGAL